MLIHILSKITLIKKQYNEPINCSVIKNFGGLLLISSSTRSYILKEHNMSGFVLFFKIISFKKKILLIFPGNVDKDSKTEDSDYSVVRRAPSNRYCQTQLQ